MNANLERALKESLEEEAAKKEIQKKAAKNFEKALKESLETAADEKWQREAAEEFLQHNLEEALRKSKEEQTAKSRSGRTIIKSVKARSQSPKKEKKAAKAHNTNAIFQDLTEEQVRNLRTLEALNTFIKAHFPYINENIEAQRGSIYDFMKYGSDKEGSVLKSLKKMKRIKTSGDANDCLIHSFLTATCKAFRKLPDPLKISVARSFRHHLYPRFKEIKDILEREGKTGPTYRRIFKKQFLNDFDINTLADIYNLNILLFQGEVTGQQPPMITSIEKGGDNPFYTISNYENIHFESVQQESGGFTISNDLANSIQAAGWSGGSREKIKKTTKMPLSATQFSYHSEQVHSAFENGAGHTRRNIVSINSGKGLKAVEHYDAAGTLLSRAQKALTAAELDCIRRNQFIPGLFKDCIQPLPLKSKTRKAKKGKKSKGVSRRRRS